MAKPHDDHQFAFYQGFYERLVDGPDCGRTHTSDQAWNEAYDQGRLEAEVFRLNLAGDALSFAAFPTMLRKMWSGGEVQSWLRQEAESHYRKAHAEGSMRAQTVSSGPVRSPCVGVCSTTLGDDVCRGCGRTFEQIRDWFGYTPEQRDEIMTRLASSQETEKPSGLSAGFQDHLTR